MPVKSISRLNDASSIVDFVAAAMSGGACNLKFTLLIHASSSSSLHLNRNRKRRVDSDCRNGLLKSKKLGV